MNSKHCLSLLIGFLVFAMIVKGVEATDPIANEGTFDVLGYVVRAPIQVDVGESFSVVFTIHPIADVELSLLEMRVYGLPVGWGEEGWKDTKWDLPLIDGEEYPMARASFEASIEGKVYGSITAVYNKVGHGNTYGGSTSFYITQVVSNAYEELENDYASLNQTNNMLQDKYTSLEIELGTTRTWTIVLIGTTIIPILTTVYFAKKRRS